MELAERVKSKKKICLTSRKRNEFRYTLYPKTIRKLNNLNKKTKKSKSFILRVAVQKLSNQYYKNKNKTLSKIHNRYAFLLIQNSMISVDKKRKILDSLHKGGYV